MSKSIDEISNALLSGLYGLVSKTTGDVNSSAADDPFVVWCKPGIPFDPEDFHFARYNLTPQGATPDEKATDWSRQLTQAAGFSRFVDFVPAVSGVKEQNLQGGVLRPGEATLSKMYKQILDASQVAKLPEPAGVNEKIAALRQQAAPLQAGYEAAQEKFDAARYALIAALVGARMSPEKDLEFRATGGGLKSKMAQALQNWEINGAKSEYENILSEIDSLRSKRSPAIWRTEAITDYETSTRGEDATFGDARLTFPFPGSFATNQGGWMDFAMSIENVESLAQSKSTKWSAGGGVGWGSLKVGGSASGATTETLNVNDTSGFKMKLAVASVKLLRADWFDPLYIRSEFWRFNPSSMDGQRGSIVSNGGSPPDGLLVGYPVNAIFVRDVEITMGELHDETSELVKTLKAEGGGGWGFGALNVSGSYERNSSVKKHKAEIADGTLKIPGLQLIGFVAEMMSLSPNPLSGLQWVGGSA